MAMWHSGSMKVAILPDLTGRILFNLPKDIFPNKNADKKAEEFTKKPASPRTEEAGPNVFSFVI
jgi:hypothetical protein